MSRVGYGAAARVELRKAAWYYVEHGAITIVAVMHHKQRPDYWADRVGVRET